MRNSLAKRNSVTARESDGVTSCESDSVTTREGEDDENYFDAAIDEFLRERAAARSTRSNASKIFNGAASPDPTQPVATPAVRLRSSGATALIVLAPPSPAPFPLTVLTSTSSPDPDTEEAQEADQVAANLNRPARDTPEVQKIAYALDALELEAALAFRLTFSPARERKLRADAAAGKDILQAINTEIGRQFTRRGYGKPATVIALEEAPGDRRLHVHGALLLVEEIERQQLREILTAAGGGPAFTGHASGNGVWIKDGPVEDARGYIRYARKDEFGVMRRLKIDRVVHMNDEARRLGKALYTDRRDRHRAPHNAAMLFSPPTAHQFLAALVVLALLDVAASPARASTTWAPGRRPIAKARLRAHLRLLRHALPRTKLPHSTAPPRM